MRVSHFWLGFHRFMITILILIAFKNVWFDFAASLINHFHVRFNEINFLDSKTVQTEKSVRFAKVRGSGLLRLQIEKMYDRDFGAEKKVW